MSVTSRDTKSQSRQDLDQFSAMEALFREDPAPLVDKLDGFGKYASRQAIAKWITKLKLFELGPIRWINNLTLIATCAFTGFLFLSYLPTYIDGISEIARYILVALVVLIAVCSSTDIRYVKWLSVGSTALFFALIA